MSMLSGKGHRYASLLGTLALLGLAGSSGCGGEVLAQEEIEREIRDELAHALNVGVVGVDCPEAVPVEPGERFECQMETREADLLEVELRVSSENADVRILTVRKR